MPVSTERRRFFREILFLGVQGAENVARQVGQQLGDAMEIAREPDPPEPDEPDALPQQPVKLEPPDGAQPRR